MTERVSRDKEILAAWPQRGVCWKVVTQWGMAGGLGPLTNLCHRYDHWGGWQQHSADISMTSGYIPGFHCFSSLADALYVAKEAIYPFGNHVVEFDYEGILGIGHFDLEDDKPAVVLLCDRIRPRSWVSLPGCGVAHQPAEIAELLEVRL